MSKDYKVVVTIIDGVETATVVKEKHEVQSETHDVQDTKKTEVKKYK